MIRSYIRRAADPIAGLALAVAFAAPAQGQGVVVIPIAPLQIIGADQCASWMPGGTVAAPTLTCVTTPPVAGAPTACTLTASPSTVTAGGTARLTAQCITGSPSIFNWSPAVFTSEISSGTVAPSSTTTYSVTPANGTGSGNTASATVTVGASPPAPPPSSPAPGSISCTGYANTRVIDMSWTGSGTRMFTSSVGGFGPDDAVVLRFTTGTVNSRTNNYPKISGAEWGGPNSDRNATLSAQPCDFGPGVGGAAAARVTMSTPLILFSVGPNNSFYYPALAQNTTYYMNIRNVPNSTCRQAGLSCNMSFSLDNMSGL